VTGGCPRHPTFSRECRDARCLAHWSPPGAPTPAEQLARWAAGESVCPNSNHECCPDFSCCKPALGWPLAKRAQYLAADPGTREKMLVGALSALVESVFGRKAYVTRGEPTDLE